MSVYPPLADCGVLSTVMADFIRRILRIYDERHLKTEGNRTVLFIGIAVMLMYLFTG